jgi:hypothetical protein
MVKTTTNPALEAAAKARSATERANQTNELCDIDEAISEWEKVVQVVADSGSSEDQADILASYASSILMRWSRTHQINDLMSIVSNLESALENLPHSATKARYDIMIRLAEIHESWYQNLKNNSEALKTAINYWEDAYGLSAILRRMKEAVRFFALPDPCGLRDTSRQMKSFQVSPTPSLSLFKMKYLVSTLSSRLFITMKLR